MELIPIPPKKTRNNVGCVLVAIAITILVVASGIVFAKPAQRVANATDACAMAQKFVKEELKAPATASFATCRAPDSVVTQVNRLWKVRSFVDAQNGFGALIRTNFAAELIYYPSTDSWTLTDLQMQAR